MSKTNPLVVISDELNNNSSSSSSGDDEKESSTRSGVFDVPVRIHDQCFTSETLGYYFDFLLFF